MAQSIPEKECDLLVIGAGAAGMAATLFAVNRKIDTIQVGSVSELNFASGLLDLLGVHPIESGRIRENPWEALKVLQKDIPTHPYSRLSREMIGQAFREFAAGLDEAGQPYRFHPDRNAQILTHLGTVKTTYGIPRTMFNGARAYLRRQPCLLIDFLGLRGFSARMIAENLGQTWPGLRHRGLTVPGTEGEIFSEPLARSLEIPPNLENLAEAIRPHLNDEEVLGLPAVLGVEQTRRLQDDLEEFLGRPVFEIPTMLPSVTGMRLREAFTKQFRSKGVRCYYHKKVIAARTESGGRFVCQVGGLEPEVIIKARAVILATGRFFGQGLHADRRRIRETVFDLPVYQPLDRSQWYQRDYFVPEGHRINLAGVETDEYFRPVDPEGRLLYEDLFSAGSILAHQDWKRQKCGSGLAITTAYAGVQAYLKLTGAGPV